jgi:oxygen-independent coproporphyrinogen-3 oxidase
VIKNYVDFLKKEIISRRTDEQIDTIFFGGGTPSILSENLFQEIADFIKQNFNLSKNCEWTIECNPESFTFEKAKTWLNCGVNRLSFGIQSLNDNELKICERLHNRKKAIEVLKNPILTEFLSINTDLIYGLPGQSEKSFAETLKIICEIPVVKHISLYELTIVENSFFDKNYEKYNFPSENEIEKITEFSRNFLQKNGFERYEVSNFAKQGFRCRHNENYWTGKKYLGFGAAAHSFDGETRSANSADLKYSLEFSEKLTNEQKRTEYLMLRLRFADGFLLSDFQEKFGNFENEEYIKELQKNGLMQIENGICKLTERGLDFADGIAAKL